MELPYGFVKIFIISLEKCEIVLFSPYIIRVFWFRIVLNIDDMWHGCVCSALFV